MRRTTATTTTAWEKSHANTEHAREKCDGDLVPMLGAGAADDESQPMEQRGRGGAGGVDERDDG